MDSSSSKESTLRNSGTEAGHISIVQETDGEQHKKTLCIGTKNKDENVQDINNYDKISTTDKAEEETLGNTDEIKDTHGEKDAEGDKVDSPVSDNEGTFIETNRSDDDVDQDDDSGTKVSKDLEEVDRIVAPSPRLTEDNPQNSEDDVMETEEIVKETLGSKANSESKEQSKSNEKDALSDADSDSVSEKVRKQDNCKDTSEDSNLEFIEDEVVEDIQTDYHDGNENNHQDKPGIFQDVSQDKSDNNEKEREETLIEERDGKANELEAKHDQGARSEDLELNQETKSKDISHRELESGFVEHDQEQDHISEETKEVSKDCIVEDSGNPNKLHSVASKTDLDELDEENEDLDPQEDTGKSDYISTDNQKSHVAEDDGIDEEDEDGRVYALRKGLNTQSCIYFNWKDICEQIEDCPDAEYEVYDDLNLAVAYILDGNDDDNNLDTPISALKKRKKKSIGRFTMPKSKKVRLSSSEKMNDNAKANKSTPTEENKRSAQGGKKGSNASNEGDSVPVYGKGKEKNTKKVGIKKTKSTNSPSAKALRLTKKNGKSTEKSRIAKKAQSMKARIQKMDEKATAREKKAHDRLLRIKMETERLEREADWEIMFAALKKYHTEIGNTNVPNSKTSPLGSWVHKQKIEFKKLTNGKASKLTQEKVDTLKSLGFQFHDRTKYLSWDDHLESYSEFITEYGPNYQPLSDTPLGKWVYTVRKNYRDLQAGKDVPNLTPERIEKLEDINFTWERPKNSKTINIKEKKPKEKDQKVSSKETKWKQRYEELLEYKEKYGNIVVPLNYGPLGRWVSNQRKYYRIAKSGQEQTYLTDERMQLLDDIEFGIKVKRGRKSPKGLNECSQEKKRIESLDWEAMYQELQEFHKEHGNCSVPFRPTTKLRTWVVSQRKEYKKLREGADSFMTASRIQKLNDLGFNFQTKPVLTWDQRFTKLIEFKQNYGHIQVPRQYEGLGKWISEQRLKYRYLQEGKPTNLTREQVEKLNGLGMVWQVIKQPPAHQRADKKPWAVRFQELLDFKERHGHTVVPQHYPELGSWVQVQRNHYKLMKQGRKSLMTMEKALILADVGFVFEVKPRKKKVVRQSLGNPYPNLPPVDTNSVVNSEGTL